MQFHPKDLSELDDLTEEHLGFSALSEGLGFTKPSKTAPSKESMASAEIHRDQNTELQRKAFSGIGAVAAGPARPAPAPSSTTSTKGKSAAASVLQEPAASQALRSLAFFIDFFLIFCPLAWAWWLSFRAQSLQIFLADLKSPSLLFLTIFSVYFLLSESFGGQSLGKMCLGLRVVEDDKYQKPIGLSHASKRLFLFVVGTAIGGLGLWASYRDPKRRPWQDRYTGSIVRRKV